ncbi:MAG: hypothetical protein GF368_00035 [Candidatus Aenigmarchaeota archaeon]|nr:hypothetical protein [Candidatus Aenigmarchaeota archaeon]
MKAQSSIEFFILSGTMLLFMIVIIYVNSNSQLRLFQLRNTLEAKRLVDRIENEISVAIEQGDGYERVFNVPQKLGRLTDYNIMIHQDGSIEVNWKGNNYLRKLPSTEITNGLSSSFEISKGYNRVENEGQVIEIIEVGP